MNKRLTVAIAGATAALLAGAGALALPASAGSVTHTLKFTAHDRDRAALGKKGGVVFDHVVSNGKLIGFDVLTFTGRNTGDVAVGLDGGLLYGSLRFSKTGALTGKVTGGTGPYAGVTGTLSGRAVTDTSTKVVVKYHG